MSFHISKLSRYEPKKKTSPVYRAQLVYITNFPSSQLPDALCVTMKRSEHDLSRWGVCHTSLIHFNKVYFGTIISHCVSEESFIKESVDLISLFLLEIMILLLLGNAHAQKFFFCSIVSSLAAFWRVFFSFLGAHVVLLARTWADWTDEKFTWMEKIRSWCIHDAPFTMP